MTDELEGIWKEPASASRNWENHETHQARTVGVSAEMRTEHLANTSIKLYR
jgi:hypothetical protein